MQNKTPEQVKRILQDNQDLLDAAARKGWATYGEEVDRLLGPGNEATRTVMKNGARLRQAHQNGTLDEEYKAMFPKPDPNRYPPSFSPELCHQFDEFRRVISTVNPGPESRTIEAPPPSTTSRSE